MNMHQQGGVANGSVKLNAGIDVSKLHLDVCVGATQQRVPNDATGWNGLTAMLLAAQVDLVGGGGHRRLRASLGLRAAERGVCVARVYPGQARDFAKSMGILAKTDQVNACVLRDFADVLARHADRAKSITPMVDRTRELLAEMMTRRRQLVDMRVAEHNRLVLVNIQSDVQSPGFLHGSSPCGFATT